jgi:hypothetical protein
MTARWRLGIARVAVFGGVAVKRPGYIFGGLPFIRRAVH